MVKYLLKSIPNGTAIRQSFDFHLRVDGHFVNDYSKDIGPKLETIILRRRGGSKQWFLDKVASSNSIDKPIVDLFLFFFIFFF
jgi:hypothetical protein